MIKICGKSLKPLILLFKNSSQSSCYPYISKKSNIVPAHKKSNNQLVNNYQPISFLPICGKIIFKNISFNKIYNLLSEEGLLNPNQSGFRSGNYCTNHLLAIIHEIFEGFDYNPSLEVRSVF